MSTVFSVACDTATGPAQHVPRLATGAEPAIRLLNAISYTVGPTIRQLIAFSRCAGSMKQLLRLAWISA